MDSIHTIYTICTLNELKPDKEELKLMFDLRTKELVNFYNLTVLDQ